MYIMVWLMKDKVMNENGRDQVLFQPFESYPLLKINWTIQIIHQYL